ncbi:hypothetical protein AVEN_163216-1 [Araneus ventricosus]|uniref:Uncharacterized protein n=1 Tax=Araneus ventricosus TaxID=182803 RepID=A0A4Y2E4I3_ARAVE|nr:hypothetical protein AVEN_163216-1 [Araneus ventricosus]
MRVRLSGRKCFGRWVPSALAFFPPVGFLSSAGVRPERVKADHSSLLHFGIFGTMEGKTSRQGQNLMKFGANGLEMVEFQRNQNPKLHSRIPFWDLDARVAVKQRICLYWDLASRVEMKLEIPRVGQEEGV